MVNFLALKSLILKSNLISTSGLCSVYSGMDRMAAVPQ